MRILRQRLQNPPHFESTHLDLIESVDQERCPQCWNRRPKAVIVMESDGVRRCPDCLVVRTEVDKARIAGHDAAQIAARQTRPQVSNAPLFDTTPAHIRIMEDASGNRVLQQSAPLVLSAGGAAVTLTITGGNFASTDTFTYSTGISDNSAPSLSGTTVWTLSLVAAGGTSTGFKNLTFNDHTYRNLLIVV
jgi:hypothetical protein